MYGCVNSQCCSNPHFSRLQTHTSIQLRLMADMFPVLLKNSCTLSPFAPGRADSYFLLLIEDLVLWTQTTVFFFLPWSNNNPHFPWEDSVFKGSSALVTSRPPPFVSSKLPRYEQHKCLLATCWHQRRSSSSVLHFTPRSPCLTPRLVITDICAFSLCRLIQSIRKLND